jgi:hypothetical protein
MALGSAASSRCLLTQKQQRSKTAVYRVSRRFIKEKRWRTDLVYRCCKVMIVDLTTKSAGASACTRCEVCVDRAMRANVALGISQRGLGYMFLP